MNSSKKYILDNFFFVFCTLGAIVLTINCIREYILNQDITNVAYKKFHGKYDEIYPSITICFTKPFVKHKLTERGLTINTYTNFLSGENVSNFSWNSSLVDIDYDNVSIHLMEHLHYIEFNLHNNDTLMWEGNKTSQMSQNHTSSVYNHIQQPKVYVSLRRAESKCYTIDIPFIAERKIFGLNHHATLWA